MDIGLADFGVGFVYGIVYKGGNKVYLNSQTHISDVLKNHKVASTRTFDTFFIILMNRKYKNQETQNYKQKLFDNIMLSSSVTKNDNAKNERN